MPDGLVKPPRRTIVVHWTDANGRKRAERREVLFERGFGPYVRFNRRTIPVDAMQTELVLADGPGHNIKWPRGAD